MKNNIKIVYCILFLYYLSGMEWVLILKVNYFIEFFGYEIYIILMDGENRFLYYELYFNIIIY